MLRNTMASTAKLEFRRHQTVNVLAGDVCGIEEVGGGEDGLPVGGLVVVQGRPWIVEALFALRSKISYYLRAYIQYPKKALKSLFQSTVNKPLMKSAPIKLMWL